MKDRFNSDEEIKKMQEEAVKKIKEMQMRSKFASDEKISEKTFKDSFKSGSGFNMRNTMPLNRARFHKSTGSKQTNSKNIIPNLMDLIFKDAEKTLLIVLIILLMDDEENFSAVLVLFYLLM